MVKEDMMKNPLRKRVLRELRDEIGKYLVVFILIKGVVILIHINSPDNGHNQQKPENGIELKITYRYRQPEYSG